MKNLAGKVCCAVLTVLSLCVWVTVSAAENERNAFQYLDTENQDIFFYMDTQWGYKMPCITDTLNEMTRLDRMFQKLLDFRGKNSSIYGVVKVDKNKEYVKVPGTLPFEISSTSVWDFENASDADETFGKFNRKDILNDFSARRNRGWDKSCTVICDQVEISGKPGIILYLIDASRDEWIMRVQILKASEKRLVVDHDLYPFDKINTPVTRFRENPVENKYADLSLKDKAMSVMFSPKAFYERFFPEKFAELEKTEYADQTFATNLYRLFQECESAEISFKAGNPDIDMDISGKMTGKSSVKYWEMMDFWLPEENAELKHKSIVTEKNKVNAKLKINMEKILSGKYVQYFLGINKKQPQQE